MPIDYEIHYLIAVPDWRPEEASPLQGFAPSLCINSGLIQFATRLPATIFDLTKEGHDHLSALRMCGAHPINWHPQSPRAIRRLPITFETPFVFVLLGHKEDPAAYREWQDMSPARPTLVAEKDADITFADLTTERMRVILLDVLKKAPPDFDPEAVSHARVVVSGWSTPSSRSIGYSVGGHATVEPNVASLQAFGYDNLVDGPFKAISKDLAPYLAQMIKTTASILTERKTIDTAPLERDMPHRPVLNLFAPGMMQAFDALQPPKDADRDEVRRFRSAKKLLEKQNGYSFQLDSEFDRLALLSEGSEKFSPHPLIGIRSMELRLATACMASLAASELSATFRLPNEINNTKGTTRLFADHYRSSKPTERKRLEGLRRVQKRLADAVPAEIVKALKEAEGDIRILSDAHIEWLDLDGLPLGLRKNTSRIPVTPGNLFVQQIGAAAPIKLTPDDFKNVLLISALKRGDPIKQMFEVALETSNPVWRDEIAVQAVEVAGENELIAALNAYGGPVLIFDGHGSHEPGRPAVLHLKDQPCDVWTLTGKVRVPPIVILSACDTHAAGRNHETTANGFLSLGARTVLSSVFPLDARDAAIFAARLLHRLAKFVPAAINTRGQAITWTEVICGMLRMQLLTDFMRRLERRHEIDRSTYEEIHTAGNIAINTNEPNPFAHVMNLLEGKGVNSSTLKLVLETAIANSSTLSYLNVGRPETIIIDTAERAKRVPDIFRSHSVDARLIATGLEG